MSHVLWKVVWTLSFVMCAVLRGSAQSAASCDPRVLDADSYALTTRGVAEVVLEERTSWWDGLLVARHAAALDDLNASATSVAKYALRLDDRNLLAHATLARQYVVIGEDANAAATTAIRGTRTDGRLAWARSTTTSGSATRLPSTSIRPAASSCPKRRGRPAGNRAG